MLTLECLKYCETKRYVPSTITYKAAFQSVLAASIQQLATFVFYHTFVCFSDEADR